MPLPRYMASSSQPAAQVTRATASGVGAIALWSILALLSVSAAAIPPLELTALGFAVSAVLGLAWLAAARRLGVLRQSPLAWAHGVGGLFGFHALYFAALAHAPAAEANLIDYLWPLLIVLLSGALLGLRLRAGHIVGTVMALGGCGLLLGSDAAMSARYLVGYGLALLSALTWALYSVWSRRFASVPTAALVGFCAAAGVLAAVAHLATETTVVPDAATAGVVLLLGLGPMGGAFYLWDIGMKRGDPRLLGTLAYATPVASTVLLCITGHAEFTVWVVASAVLVAGGGLLAARADPGANP